MKIIYVYKYESFLSSKSFSMKHTEEIMMISPSLARVEYFTNENSLQLQEGELPNYIGDHLPSYENPEEISNIIK